VAAISSGLSLPLSAVTCVCILGPQESRGSGKGKSVLKLSFLAFSRLLFLEQNSANSLSQLVVRIAQNIQESATPGDKRRKSLEFHAAEFVWNGL
jgi:hypothetical protein